jgi:hypothetical protein
MPSWTSNLLQTFWLIISSLHGLAEIDKSIAALDHLIAALEAWEMPSAWHAPGFHTQTKQDHRQWSRHGSLVYETLALPANSQPSSTSDFRLRPLPFTASKNSSLFGKFIVRCSKRRMGASLQTAIALASGSGTTHGEGGRSVLRMKEEHFCGPHQWLWAHQMRFSKTPDWWKRSRWAAPKTLIWCFENHIWWAHTLKFYHW